MHTRRQSGVCLSLLSVMVISLVGMSPQDGRMIPGVCQTEIAGLEQRAQKQEEESKPPLSSAADACTWFHHQVRPGDTLWAISGIYGVPVAALVAHNALADPNLLRPGQMLRVPSSQARIHRVQPGDSLWRIAASYNTSVDALVLENGISSPDRLRVGDILVIPETGGSDRATVPAPSAASLLQVPELMWPLSARGRLTSPFGPRWSGFHTGIDVAAPTGTGVRAAASGVVTLAGRLGNYGLTVIIEHGHGIETLYAHLSRIEVAAGQHVSANQLVGLVGNTGRSTGPHLHFELRVDGEPVDPMPALPIKD